MNKFDLFLVTSSSSFNSNDKGHRRTPSGGNQLDRPGAPPPNPPNPPSVIIVSSPATQSRQRQSLPVSNLNYEYNLSSPIEEKISSNDVSTESSSSNATTPTSENVNVGKLISELNNRMAAARVNNTPSNNVRASSIRNSTITSPGETTDF